MKEDLPTYTTNHNLIRFYKIRYWAALLIGIFFTNKIYLFFRSCPWKVSFGLIKLWKCKKEKSLLIGQEERLAASSASQSSVVSRSIVAGSTTTCCVLFSFCRGRLQATILARLKIHNRYKKLVINIDCHSWVIYFKITLAQRIYKLSQCNLNNIGNWKAKWPIPYHACMYSFSFSNKWTNRGRNWMKDCASIHSTASLLEWISLLESV